MSNKVPEQTIALDIDGVCYEWDKTARYLLGTHLGVHIPESQNWDYIMQNCTKEEWKWLWSKGIELGLFRHGHMVKGAAEGVRRLAELGEVVAVTSRPKVAINDTLAWLSYHQFPLSGVHIISGKQKSEVFKADIVIDDGIHNIVDALVNTNAKALLFDRLWNQSYVNDNDRYTRCFGWEDVIRKVSEITRG